MTTTAGELAQTLLSVHPDTKIEVRTYNHRYAGEDMDYIEGSVKQDWTLDISGDTLYIITLE